MEYRSPDIVELSHSFPIHSVSRDLTYADTGFNVAGVIVSLTIATFTAGNGLPLTIGAGLLIKFVRAITRTVTRPVPRPVPKPPSD